MLPHHLLANIHLSSLLSLARQPFLQLTRNYLNFQMLVSVLTVPNPESKSDSKINDEKELFYSYTYSNRKGIE